MTNQEHEPMTPFASLSPLRSRWGIGLWLLLTLLGVWILTELVRMAPCWAVALAVLLVAYPIWLAQREAFVFKRRVLLTGATHTDSRLRRWLWQGRIGSILLIIPSLLLAVLVLVVMLRLSAWHWLVLVVDVAFLTWMYHWLQQHVQREVRPEMVGVFVRRWPLWLANMAFLGLVFLILNFFVLGAPDLRFTPWLEVLTQSFHTYQESVACPALGLGVGLLGSLEQTSWALAQQFIPQLPGIEWRLLAWMVFLLQLGVLALLITTLQLGVLAMVEYRALRIETLTGESTLSRTFILTILLLAVPFMFAAHQLRDLDLQALADASQERWVWLDPCQAQQEELDAFKAEVAAELSAEQEELLAQTETRIDQELEAVFARMEAGVDAYLDWYFTVTGEYQRLAALVVGDFAAMMAARLERHLFTETDFEQRLSALDAELRATTQQYLTELRATTQARLGQVMATDACHASSVDLTTFANLERDAWRAGGAAAGGSATGVATVALAKKVMAGTMAKVAIQETAQIAVTTAAKMAAKKGTGVLAAGIGGAALCAATGPGAVLCGLGAATAAWLTIDHIAIGIDERLSRETMRADILAALQLEKEELREVLQASHRLLILQGVQALEDDLGRPFIPARDGL